MERLAEKRRRNEPWNCCLCDSFQALTLRILLRHYNNIHANEPNFRVVCGIDKCPATFRVFNSFYKHVLRYHKESYDEKFLVADHGNLNECCADDAGTCESTAYEDAEDLQIADLSGGSDSSDEFEDEFAIDEQVYAFIVIAEIICLNLRPGFRIH